MKAICCAFKTSPYETSPSPTSVMKSRAHRPPMLTTPRHRCASGDTGKKVLPNIALCGYTEARGLARLWGWGLVNHSQSGCANFVVGRWWRGLNFSRVLECCAA
jgi:hypothetical protein